LDFNLEWIN